MGEVLGYRDIAPQQRCGGYFATLQDLENYVRFLSFDVYVAEHCDRGWFCTPASMVNE